MVIRWYNNTVFHLISKVPANLNYNTTQRLPLGTVTLTPPLTVTGPTDDAEYPDGIV